MKASYGLHYGEQALHRPNVSNKGRLSISLTGSRGHLSDLQMRNTQRYIREQIASFAAA